MSYDTPGSRTMRFKPDFDECIASARFATASALPYRLFVTQCFYRVHVRGFPGWIDSEYNPRAEGNDQ